MKILIVSNLFYPYERGGAERIAKATALALKKQGHEVTVLTMNPRLKFSQPGGETQYWEGLKIIRCFPLNLHSYWFHGRYGFFRKWLWRFIDVFQMHTFLYLFWLCIKEKPQLIMTQNLCGLGYLIPIAIREYRKRFKEVLWIQILHDIQYVYPSGVLICGEEKRFLNRSFFQRMYENFCRRLFVSCDFAIFPSRFLKDFYENRGFFQKSQRMLLPNPIEKDFIALKTDVSSLYKRKYFLYVGQIERHKGLFWLLRRLESFSQDLFELHIVGNGSAEKELKNVIAHRGNALYYGSKEGKELSEMFSIMHFLIFPSRCYENDPGVIPLSLLNGTPVITVSLGGSAERVVHGKNGFVFDPSDEKSFDAVFNEALRMNAVEYQRMVREATKFQGMDADVYIHVILKALSKKDADM
ncbi:MAG: glycosyltransferase [Parcubacteria group bacterium]|nr:glycosyltransferase [Parcubacteria group bacterium]